MKRFTTFLLFVLSGLVTYGQSQVRAAEIVADERLFPPLRDTSTAPKRVGELRVRPSDTSLYMAISMTAIKKWQKILKLTDVAGGENIYNINGILTGNRTLTGLNNTRSLTLDSLNSFSVRRNNVTRFEVTSGISRMASVAGDSYAYATTGEAGLWNDNSNMIVHNDDSIIFNSVGRNYRFRDIPHNSSNDLRVVAYDTTDGQLYRKPIVAYNFTDLQDGDFVQYDEADDEWVNTSQIENKRWVARVGSTTSSATPTINTDNVDIYKLTAQAADITSFTTNLSGSPNDGDVLEIQITGTATRAITWGASFVSSTVTLPTTTAGTATLSVILQYYTTSSYGNNKWVCVNFY